MDKRKAIEIIIKDKTYYLFNHINMESIQNKEVNGILNLYQDHNKNIEENIQNNILHLIMNTYTKEDLKKLFSPDDDKGELIYIYIIGNTIFVNEYSFSLKKTSYIKDYSSFSSEGKHFYGSADFVELREGNKDDPKNRLYYYIIEGILKNKDSVNIIDTIKLDELKEYETVKEKQQEKKKTEKKDNKNNLVKLLFSPFSIIILILLFIIYKFTYGD